MQLQFFRCKISGNFRIQEMLIYSVKIVAISRIVSSKLVNFWQQLHNMCEFWILNIIMELETEFNIDLTAEDTESDNFRTPGGIVKIIETK